MTDSIERGGRSAHVYDGLRDLIVRGGLAPGARVVEQEVAARMGVGRTPVREALQLLLTEGYLVASEGGRRQLAVAPLRDEDVEELFGLIADLEAAAVRKISELDETSRATLAASLGDANDLFGSTVAQVPLDLDGAYETHKAFHATLTDSLAGPRLAWLLGMVRPQVGRYEYVYGALLEGALGVATNEHEDIVAAVREGDAVRVEAALRHNWRNASSRLRGAIRRVPSAPEADTDATSPPDA
ncbi:GntR family transcriptional regulator [Longimicrobium terrae]|uniref:DNA-binding GntR family transcriptional regulator n=1 Tax=Longimicrobium terrae TaxID=1639882 RepID=A0A841GTQ8_9BACT|nr:GntR family transcriptional regulator [Longimicrobium terrae]MBB4634562.1 DNA-binding GntR family transcriptional regulator [Longimicrobium terrae]MBB6068548.1 DNA-binding GntR family transcriptional regulator [Longimicrobium terrae]NNC27736.1 GntR family transcriptional regulator [Longimicrobium terrae]